MDNWCLWTCYRLSTTLSLPFLDLFAYRKPANLRKPQIVNFMCYHNTCGQLDKDNCLSPLNCCHKAFTVPIDGTWITTTFLRAIFFRNINVPDITHVNGFPSLLFLWNSALSFNIRISKENMTGQGFARFKCGIIKNH